MSCKTRGSGLRPAGTGRGGTRHIRVEVRPDKTLGQLSRLEPKARLGQGPRALHRTCSFMTEAPGASSLAGVAQLKGIQPVFGSQTCFLSGIFAQLSVQFIAALSSTNLE